MATRPLDLSQERCRGRERRGGKEARWGGLARGEGSREAALEMDVLEKSGKTIGKPGKQEEGKEEAR